MTLGVYVDSEATKEILLAEVEEDEIEVFLNGMFDRVKWVRESEDTWAGYTKSKRQFVLLAQVWD